jgi:co-chaperonin GroES (HSP10)
MIVVNYRKKSTNTRREEMFEPLNRYIQIEVQQSEHETETGILLPADFAPKEDRYTPARIVSWSPDVRFADQLRQGAQILIDTSMAEEINVNGITTRVILDNYVLGLINR